MGTLEKSFKTKYDFNQTYNNFWAWFEQNAKAFFEVLKEEGDIQNDILNKLSAKLNEIKEDVTFLVGMAGRNTAELILTSDGMVTNIFFIEELIQAAPLIEGWKFTALGPGRNMKDDYFIEKGRFSFTHKNLNFYANDLADYPDEIDITVVYDEYNEENELLMFQGVDVFLDNYLGELDYIESIDNLDVVGPEEAKKELIPIEKLKSYLKWRQKEFIEKYEGVRHGTELDKYASFEGKLSNDEVFSAFMNTDLLQWDSKASHPWILVVKLTNDGSSNKGMPGEENHKLNSEIEGRIKTELRDFEGYLNIGSLTSGNMRLVYYACREFRKPSKILFEIEKEYEGQLEITYDIDKDKYWRSFNHFRAAVI